ncbi:MAG: Asp-tRNA(Asn)/Glu-tRNA(Gln) amidotransferase subunit GatC [Candidatus Taylorbacteria bacterium]
MITPEEIKHLATLSRIKITDEDMVSLVKEFDGILGYIDQLKKVDVSTDTEGRVGAVKNVTRDDTARTISASDREALLNEAPDREGDFIAVKKIIAQED